MPARFLRTAVLTWFSNEVVAIAKLVNPREHPGNAEVSTVSRHIVIGWSVTASFMEE